MLFGVNKSEVDYLTGMGFDVYVPDTSYTSAPKDFIKKQLEARGFVVA